jgi:cysteinyl-tRNA synthetase
MMRISTVALLLSLSSSQAFLSAPMGIVRPPITGKKHGCLLAKNPKSNNSNNTKKKQGFEQYGEIDPSYCTLSKDEILDWIQKRNKARRSQHFQKADEILAILHGHRVHLDDATKLWRADGNEFDLKGYSNMKYTKSPHSKPMTDEDEQYVNQKLKERSEAKLKKDFLLADDIRDELRFLKNVIVDDKNLTWKVTDDFKTEYSYGGKRLNNVSEEEIQNIAGLIKERSDAKAQKKYDVADEILEKLMGVCGVRVDDAKKTWFFLPKLVEDTTANE